MKTPKQSSSRCRQIVQFGELVLRQRLGREEVERPRIRIFQDRVQHRQVVAKRLARSRRRHHHEILPGARQFRRGRLMRIKLLDAFGPVSRRQLRPHPFRHGPELRLARRNVLHAGQHLVRAISRRQRPQRLLDRIQRRSFPYRQALPRCRHAFSPSEAPPSCPGESSSLFVRSR